MRTVKQAQRSIVVEIVTKKGRVKIPRNKEIQERIDQEAQEAQRDRKMRIEGTIQEVKAEIETRAVQEGDMMGKRIVREEIAEIAARKVGGRVKI